MADPSLDALLAAIRREESGSYAGNYSAHNPGGAMGAYQIMPANLTEWSREALGYPIDQQTFMGSPSMQDQIARYIIGGYYRRYGAAGAASMWFSGQPNPNSRASDGSTTVNQYVNNVMGFAGAPEATSAGSQNNTGTLGSDTGAATPAAVVRLDAKTLAAMYGLSTSLINSDKSLKDIFSQAVAQQWTPDVFTAHLKNTKWWATQSDTMRQFITLKYTDPATFAQKIDQAAYHVNSLAVAVGYGNLLGQGTALGKMNSTLQTAVLKIMQNGWSDQQISDYLGGMVQFHGKEMDGQAGQEYDKLQTYAYANGLPLSSSWYLQNVRGIVGGKTTSEAVLNQLRQQSASMYSAYSQQILAGQNALDLAAPYVHEVSQLLEIPELSVGMNNKYIQKAMTTPLQKGQMAGAQYPLWQLENDVRDDPMWRKTNNARETTAQVTRQIGQMFGGSF